MRLTCHNGTEISDVVAVGRVGIKKSRDLQIKWRNETKSVVNDPALYAKGDGVVLIIKRFPPAVEPGSTATCLVRWFPGRTVAPASGGKTQETVESEGEKMVDIIVVADGEQRMFCMTAWAFDGPTYEDVFNFVMTNADEYEIDGDDPVDIIGGLVASGVVQI